MSARKRVFTALATLALSMSSAVGCDLIYPAGYVAPTHEELISKSKAAFIGRVIGYRLDDGTTIDHDIECPWDKSDHCWEKRYTIISAILSVDVDVRGMREQALFEDDRSADAGADCGNDYSMNTVYLVTGFDPQPLKDMPSLTTIDTWRSLPLKRLERVAQ